MIGYPTMGKEKAVRILEAFCKGAGGRVVSSIPERLLPGPAVFYGVTPDLRHLWDQVLAEGREFYYCDNAYFDKTREVYFRVTKNRLQHTGVGTSDGTRFERHKIAIKPWRETGAHLLVCPQSEQFMRDCALYPGPSTWAADTVRELSEATGREIRVRTWSPNKKEAYRTLPEALRNGWALVTYSSASAISAVLNGIPAFCTAEDCIAGPVTQRQLDIETPFYPSVDQRLRWAQVVADQQWTLDEMRSGLAWRMLNEPAPVAEAA